jgi:hypothetical protein
MSQPFAGSWAQSLGALDPIPADKLSVLLRASGSGATPQCTGLDLLLLLSCSARRAMGAFQAPQLQNPRSLNEPLSPLALF